MSLCMAWKSNDTVHFASDSRLTLAQNSFADVGIKISTLPITIYDPVQENSHAPRTVAHNAVLGMCFAGSAINSLTIKESIAEVLKSLQHVPGHTDMSMAGIANFVFKVYQIISKIICKTAIGPNGRASILIGGYCTEKRIVRAFHLSTDANNNHAIEEVLTDHNHFFVGSGKIQAEDDLPQSPIEIDYFNILKSVIQDGSIPTVGGNIQYGCFKDSGFVVYGIIDLAKAAKDVHYWRGALDLNSQEFMDGHETFVPGFPYVDPYSTFGGI